MTVAEAISLRGPLSISGRTKSMRSPFGVETGVPRGLAVLHEPPQDRMTICGDELSSPFILVEDLRSEINNPTNVQWVIGLLGSSAVESTKPVVAKETIAAPRIAQSQLDVEWIRTKLYVTISDLADLFGFTRATLYSWRGGAQAKADNAEKVAAVREALSAFDENKLGFLKQIWLTEHGSKTIYAHLQAIERRGSPEIKYARDAIEAHCGSLDELIKASEKAARDHDRRRKIPDVARHIISFGDIDDGG